MLSIFRDADYLVSWETFIDQLHTIIKNERLLVAIEGQIYSYEEGSKILLSQVVFNEMLPLDQMPESLNQFAQDDLSNSDPEYDDELENEMQGMEGEF